MKTVRIIGVMVLLLFMVGSASAASMSLQKSASTTTYSYVGQKITYTYIVKNTGNEEITGLTITDDKTSVKLESTTLAKGKSVKGTAIYTVKQGDLDTGSVTNTASAKGKYKKGSSYGQVYSNKATVKVAAAYKPALKIVKSASPTTFSSSGQLIKYTYVVTNTGNVKIKGPIKITDDKIGAFTISTGSLESGKSVTKTATYTIKQADIKTGSVTNKAYATGYFNNKLIKSNEATATVTVSKPALSLTKSASPKTYEASGQTITYTYKVTNSGTIAVSGPIKVIDDKLGTLTISTSSLSPGKYVTKSVTYTIKQADINAGSITNKAYATGTYNNKPIISNYATATVTLTVSKKPALKLEKTASPKVYSSAGQIITYTYKVTNSGDVVISKPIKVTDNKLGTVLVSNNALGLGQSITGTATYTITKADLKAGSVANEAFATGTYNCKEVKSNTTTEIVSSHIDIPEFPSMVLPVATIVGLMFILQRRGKEK